MTSLVNFILTEEAFLSLVFEDEHIVLSVHSHADYRGHHSRALGTYAKMCERV
jgi:hypothetical protein